MKKLIKPSIERLAILVMLLFFSWQGVVQAQTPPYRNTTISSTGSNTFPFNTTANRKTQFLYRPGDLGVVPAGLIDTLWFRNGNTATGNATGPGTYSNFQLRMGQFTSTVFPGATSTDFYTPAELTTVISLPSYTINQSAPSGAWFYIPLPTPVVYDPTKTLVVDFEMDNRTSASGFSVATYAVATAPNHQRLTAGTNGALTGTASTALSDVGLSVAPLSATDVRAQAIVSPTGVLSIGQTLQISMQLHNLGTNSLTSATVGYQIDNNPAVTEAWSGNLASLAGSLHSFSTTAVAPSAPTFTMKVWVTNANGAGADGNPGNDTLTAQFCVALVGGTYTIGGASANFSSITEAVSALNCGGITGPVTFSINSGTYYGGYTLTGIPGASPTNRITFTSASGNPADVVLVHDTLLSTSGARHHFNMLSQSYISFTNLTFRRLFLGTALSAALMFEGGSSDGHITGCSFEDLSGSTSSLNYGIRMNLSDGMQLINNTFDGYYYSVYLAGASINSAYSQNTTLISNTFNNYIFGVFLSNASQFSVIGNNFNGVRPLSTLGYGIYASRVMGFDIRNNQVLGRIGNAGIFIFNANQDSIGIFYNRVYNNIISGTVDVSPSILSYGIYVGGSYSATATSLLNPHDRIELVNNTIDLAVSSTTTAASGAIHLTGGSATSPFYSQLIIRNNLISARPGVSGILPSNYAGIYYQGAFIVDSTSSDFNNVYLVDAAGLPSVTNAGWRVLSTNFNTAADFALIYGKEGNSGRLSPGFLSPSLLKPTSLALDNKGTPVSYVTNDISGATRSSTTPDVGAYEFTGAAFSTIVFQPLGDTIASASRSFTAAILDSTNALIAGSARVFYKKGMLGSWVLALSTGNSGNTYNFNIDYAAIGGAAALDTIYYYLAVENAAGIVTTAPLGGSGLTLPGALAPPVLHAYLINPSMTGTYTIGVSALADFPTITAAANFYNQAYVSGPLNLVLIDTLYSSNEVFPIVFNNRPGVSANNPVRFFPSPNISHSHIQGNSAANNAVLVLNEVAHFTIDGSKSGTATRDLTVENSSTFSGTAVIHLISTAGGNLTNVVIKNLRIRGGINAANGAYGIIGGSPIISSVSQAIGLQNLKIINNSIENVFAGIDVKGTIQSPLQQVEVFDNEVGALDTVRTVTGRGISIQNLNQGKIDRNHVFNMYSLLSSNTTGIELSGTANTNVSISYNHIEGIINKNVGGWGAYGINVIGGQVLILNNVIANLSTVNYSVTSTTYNAFGIRIGGVATADVLYNSVNMFGDYTNVASGGASGAALCWISSLTGAIQNNIFNVNYTSSNTTGVKLFSALWGPTNFSFANVVINHNAYFVAPNSEHIVGRLGGNTSIGLFADVAAWRAVTSAGISANDSNSIPLLANELAPFTSNVNLQIPSGTATFAESGGLLIPAIGPSNIDFNGQVRPAFNGTAPDMGAYEFAGVRPAFAAPMQLDSVSIDPPTGQCFLTSRNVAALVSSGTAVVSGKADRWVNGIPQSSIILNLSNGSNLNGLWTGVIPATTNSGDVLEISLVFVDSLGDTLSTYMGAFIDELLSVNAGADQTITRGDVATLTATVSGGLAGNGQLSTLNSGGNGANGITFNVSAQNDLRIDTLYIALYGGQQGVVNVWRRNTAINGAPTIDSANGWSSAVLSYPVQIFNPSITGPLVYSAIPVPGGIEMLAGQTFGFYIGTSIGNVAYTTHNTNLQDVYSDVNMTIATGPNVGYGGSMPNPGNHPRMFNGAIGYTVTGADVIWSAYSPGSNNQVAQFGTDTTTNLNTTYPAPYGNWYWGAKHQMMILASELMAQGIAPGGEISALSFEVAVPMGTALTDFTIRMGHTGANSVGAFQTGLQPVYFAPAYSDMVGWNRHAFQAPFVWDGVSNVIIETCFNNGNYTNNAQMRHSSTFFVSTAMYYNDSTGVCANPLILQSGVLRPNMRLETSGTTVGTGLSIQVSPQANTVYRATANKGVCTVFDEVLVTVNQPNNQLIGTVRYKNNSNTPLNNVEVYLIDLATNTTVAQALVDSTNGQFSFAGFVNGNYYLWSQTMRAWGGVNATDALAVGNHFIGSMPLNPLPQYAGDVNGSNVLNSTDALLIARRFVGYDNSFVMGNWAFETPVINASGNGLLMQDVFGLCFGDVNGSYQPSSNRLLPQIALEMQEVLAISQESKWVPVRIDRDLELGALSLVLQLPVGMEVLDVRSALGSGQFDFQRRGQELRISWFSTTALQLNENDVLFNLEVAAISNWTGEVAIGGLSEAANGLAEAYPMVNLRLPALRSILNGEFTAVVYPNPASTNAQLLYRLPEAGKLGIRITDALGKVVMQLDEQEVPAGMQELALDAYLVAAGTYHVQLSYQQGSEWQQKTLKLQVVR